MTCSHCAALNRENADLRAEVEAWRATDGEQRLIGERAERLHRWKTLLRLTPRAAEVAMMLAAAPGALSNARLVVQSAADGGPDTADQLAKVYICQVRAAIGSLGLRHGIETVRNYGYRMDRSAARALVAELDGGV
ncbi:MAG TPA: helix-turn-helix domain-containing protein [Brevundimonas sp.]|nr:helix-turn-helix domain-containing protein [Brevundimonas sp.]